MATTAPPGEGWKLQVKMRFTANGKIFNRGVEIKSVDDLGPNALQLFDTGRVRWVPPSTECAGEPIPVETTPAKIEYRQAVVADAADCDGAEDRWHTSVALTETASNCGQKTAEQLLMNHPVGGEIFKQASRAKSERFARENNLHGRRPFVGV